MAREVCHSLPNREISYFLFNFTNCFPQYIVLYNTYVDQYTLLCQMYTILNLKLSVWRPHEILPDHIWFKYYLIGSERQSKERKAFPWIKIQEIEKKKTVRRAKTITFKSSLRMIIIFHLRGLLWMRLQKEVVLLLRKFPKISQQIFCNHHFLSGAESIVKQRTEAVIERSDTLQDFCEGLPPKGGYATSPQGYL